MRKNLLRATVLSAVALMFSAIAMAGTVNLKIAHAQAITEPAHIAWLYMKEQLEKRGNGEWTVEVFPASQLGDDRELTQAVQLGDIDCATPSSPAVAPFAPEMFVLDTFFLFDDNEHVYRVLDGPAGKAIDDAIAPKNLKVIAWWDTGFRYITNSKRPIRTPADLAGIKIRVMENPLHLAAWEALGANPTPMAYAEVFTALQQGTIDAQENPWIQIHSGRFYEVQKYISKTGHIYTARPAIMSRDKYESLTPAQKELFDQVVLEATKIERAEYVKQTDEREKIVVDSGLCEIIEPTAAEKEQFREVLKSVEPLVRKEAGDAITDLFLKEAAAKR